MKRRASYPLIYSDTINLGCLVAFTLNLITGTKTIKDFLLFLVFHYILTYSIFDSYGTRLYHPFLYKVLE